MDERICPIKHRAFHNVARQKSDLYMKRKHGENDYDFFETRNKCVV